MPGSRLSLTGIRQHDADVVETQAGALRIELDSLFGVLDRFLNVARRGVNERQIGVVVRRGWRDPLGNGGLLGQLEGFGGFLVALGAFVGQSQVGIDDVLGCRRAFGGNRELTYGFVEVPGFDRLPSGIECLSHGSIGRHCGRPVPGLVERVLRWDRDGISLADQRDVPYDPCRNSEIPGELIRLDLEPLEVHSQRILAWPHTDLGDGPRPSAELDRHLVPALADREMDEVSSTVALELVVPVPVDLVEHDPGPAQRLAVLPVEFTVDASLLRRADHGEDKDKNHRKQQSGHGCHDDPPLFV